MVTGIILFLVLIGTYTLLERALSRISTTTPLFFAMAGAIMDPKGLK